MKRTILTAIALAALSITAVQAQTLQTDPRQPRPHARFAWHRDADAVPANHRALLAKNRPWQ